LRKLTADEIRKYNGTTISATSPGIGKVVSQEELALKEQLKALKAAGFTEDEVKKLVEEKLTEKAKTEKKAKVKTRKAKK
jgi:DNA-binding transcriptional MerR regulator